MTTTETHLLVPIDLKGADTEGLIDSAMKLKTMGATIDVPVPEEKKAGVVEVLARVRTAKTKIEALRKTAKQPSLDAGRELDKQAKELTKALDDVDVMLEQALLMSTDLEEDRGKQLPAKSKTIGALGSSATTQSEYRFEVDRSMIWKTTVTDAKGVEFTVPETCLVDIDARVCKSQFRTYINNAKKKGKIPNNVPGFKIVRNDKIRTRTSATLAIPGQEEEE